jgi:hypothetical protein
VHERSYIPLFVPDLNDATNIDYAPYVACALRKRGDVACWGGKPDARFPPPAAPAWKVPNSDGATSFVVLEHAIFGRRSDGSTFGWPDPPPPSWAHVRALSSSSNAAFSSMACAITNAGLVSCLRLQLGTPSGPVEIAALGSPSALALGQRGSLCGLSSSGGVVCVDENGSPLKVPVFDDVIEIVGLDAFSVLCCIRHKTGKVECAEAYPGGEAEFHQVMESDTPIFSAGSILCTLDAVATFRCVHNNGTPVSVANLVSLGR